ncbi:MAG: hypothetical protein RBR59_00865 [Sulfurimonadaceae bacterium]|jgi:hypothetical protein|nr:hypothetical protein [Sulfurimonadaceae bacterium]
MKIETSYNYETKWTLTQEADLLRIIIDEIGDADPKGTLDYIKEGIQKGKIISVGSCKFRALRT